ncbi:MAG: hypothetical protein U5J62_10475 [Desulfurivibrio sp.]|nr:hypothetical protein [Desulfurivibrio sp.]
MAGVALLWLLLAGGCATRPPVGEPLIESRRQEVVDAFQKEMRQRRQQLRCLDAEAEVSWRNWLRSGTMPGYLQLKRPGGLQYVGLDPLGRPLLALVVVDDAFQLAVISEAKVYEGATGAGAFRRHLPPGIEPRDLSTSLFAWLSGGLPFTTAIEGVYRELGQEVGKEEPAAPGFWLEFDSPVPARLLYRPGHRQPGRIERLQLFAERHSPPTEFIYSEHQALTVAAGARKWPVPHRLELATRQHQGLELTMVLNDVRTACPPDDDLRLPVPPGFSRETVE